MNIGIIGTGLTANIHADLLRGIGQKLVAVVGSSLKSASAFAEAWQVSAFSDDLQLLANPEIDCVHICTPPTLHFAALKQCLLWGKHLICEKPLCLSPEEAWEIYQLAQEKGLHVGVNFNVRYHSQLSEAKSMLAQKDFGSIFLLHGVYLQEFHALPEAYSWRYEEKLAGSLRAVSEIGSHLIDISRFLTQLEIHSVSASFGRQSPWRKCIEGIMYPSPTAEEANLQVGSEDAAVISIRFQNGAIGSFVLSEVSHGRNNCLKLEITGSQKSLWWDSEKPFQLSCAQKGQGVQTWTNAFGNSFADTVKAFFKDFYGCLENQSCRSSSYATALDGYKVATVCQAIEKSAQEEGAWTTVSYKDLSL